MGTVIVNGPVQNNEEVTREIVEVEARCLWKPRDHAARNISRGPLT